MRYIDLFCGIGGMRIGLERACESLKIESECVLSSDIKKNAIKTYGINFSDKVSGDIIKINTEDIPDFDMLIGGFPCQAFSTAGKRLGFQDTRGTLFFEIARIIKTKSPKMFLLENVEGLIQHGGIEPGSNIGKTFSTILNVLSELGYFIKWEVVDAQNYGLAQRRKRVYIVGSKLPIPDTVFKPNKEQKTVVFNDIREFNKPVECSLFSEIILNSITKKDLYGKVLRDKRGGDNNIHSWNIGLKGETTSNQKQLMEQILLNSRQKKFAEQVGVDWYECFPLSESQIKIFNKNVGVSDDLKYLVECGYLKMEYPLSNKIPRTDLEIGYRIATGKLSFQYACFLDNYKVVPTLVATDISKIAVIEENGLRTLTSLEIKKLFGFPADFNLHTLKQNEIYDLFGNTVAVNVVETIAYNLIKSQEV